MLTAFAAKFGPHNVISVGEIVATLVGLAFALIVFSWFASHVH
ncbi:MAG TPA: hypothetical protein VHC69_07915 [Polyangiaceae bacterium]|nr:hypothetical protein [Polyangiaceae bacterium]